MIDKLVIVESPAKANTIKNDTGEIQTVDFNSQSVLGQTDQRNKMIRNLINDFNFCNFSINFNITFI